MTSIAPIQLTLPLILFLSKTQKTIILKGKIVIEKNLET